MSTNLVTFYASPDAFIQKWTIRNFAGCPGVYCRLVCLLHQKTSTEVSERYWMTSRHSFIWGSEESTFCWLFWRLSPTFLCTQSTKSIQRKVNCSKLDGVPEVDSLWHIFRRYRSTRVVLDSPKAHLRLFPTVLPAHTKRNSSSQVAILYSESSNGWPPKESSDTRPRHLFIPQFTHYKTLKLFKITVKPWKTFENPA